MSDTLQTWLREAEHIVFFGGAGVSTESGIPDFRSTDGLYHQQYRYPPEVILSHDFFLEHTEEFFRFYRAKMLYPDAKPNGAHLALAGLEQASKLDAIVTQNIDGLHQAAGSKNVFELHGSVLRNYCTRCGRSFDIDYMINSEGVPHCSCGGVIKPDVVLYEEALDDETVRGAVNAIASADTLIIAGTSMVVYPAAGLVNYFNGKHLVVINMSPTSADSRADLLICGKVGKVLGGVEI